MKCFECGCPAPFRLGWRGFDVPAGYERRAIYACSEHLEAGTARRDAWQAEEERKLLRRAG